MQLQRQHAHARRQAPATGSRQPLASQACARRITGSAKRLTVRAEAATDATAATPAAAAPTATQQQAVVPQALWTELKESCAAYKKAPPSMKFEYSSDVLDALNALKAAGGVPKWGAEAPEAGAAGSQRRAVMQGELRQAGIKAPDQLATPSVRNDAAFLYTTMGVCGGAALLLGQLPGDWGFFSSYLAGSVILVVMGIGSTAPGLLAAAIDQFGQLWPDYRERVVAHEAAHLLIGYLMGVPVTSYSLAIGREHVEFAEAKLQARIITRDLSDEEVDALAAVAVAGMAAEGLRYEEVQGQNADLFDLQRILLRSTSKLSNSQQQSVTRWAVWRAAQLLKRYKAEYEAVQAALAQGAGVDEVIEAIERTRSAAAA